MKKWHKVLDDKELLADGRVMTVTAEHKDFCLVHYDGKYAALDNKCPHQGGPLGEGSIEKGLLRCPWHGWDYDPITGKAPGFDDGVETFNVEEREDGIYIELEEEDPHIQTVTDVMVKTMTNWGVDTVFGMVGHSNLGLADAMRRAEARGELRYFAIRHEGGGAFAASAYGKLTGTPAACFAIAGPGSTNMYTGLWDAKVDRAPILALTGQVATQVVGTGNFQELDLVRAYQSVAEFNHRVQHSSDYAELMALAVKHAVIKRDVSHLTFPDEVQTVEAPDAKPQTREGRIASLKISPDPAELDKAVDTIRDAKRPLIITGHGARFNMPAIIQFAEFLKCPVVTTFKGKGQISDDHPLGGGVLGRSGTPIASWFMNECDLLIVFGASFSKHTGISPKKKTIQIDFDPMALAKFHKVEIPLFGEISETLMRLNQKLADHEPNTDHTKEVAQRWEIWRDEKDRRLQEDRGKGVSSSAIFNALNNTAPETAIMCVDVGNNAYSFGRYYESKSNNTFLMSGYLGSIGFALPASMGAWAAQGDTRPVIAVAGDAGFAQYMGELNTIVMYKMPIKIIVLNNSELGKISKEQRAANLEVWKTDITNPSFAAYAENCGAMGILVKDKDRLENAMHMAFRHDGPALVEIMADPRLL